MVRPKKHRFVSVNPDVLYFKPRGIPLVDLKEVELSMEELEALRLKDWEGMEQVKCAKKMKVSRPTFHRIYKSARKKVADFIVHGKALKIGGGVYVTHLRLFACLDCGHEWEHPYGKGRPSKCPKCKSGSMKSKHKIKNNRRY